MPVAGFVDSNGERVTFDELRAGKGVFRTRSGHEAPRAMLRALASHYRGSDHYGADDAVSVTTIISPIQKVRLEQRYDLYVEWDDNIWASYGTIAHGFFEAGAAEGDVVEHRLVIEREGVKIGGTFDLLESANHSYYDKVDGEPVYTGSLYRGRDYKVTSAYGVKLAVQAELETPGRGVYREKPDYFWQGNLYHLMTQDPDVKQVVNGELVPWPLAGKVKVENWALAAIVRDWSERTHGKVIGPVEMLDIPLLELSRVENYLSQRIALYLASGMCDDAGLPACTPEETWHGKRCAKYCAAAPVCKQINPDA